jgi:tetratricopeptide (TPR) repeat protein
MSRARRRETPSRMVMLARCTLPSLLAGGLLAGCVPKAAPETETPDGPSEASETVDVAVIEAGMAEGADEAAKKAAAQQVLQKVKDRDPEEEKKKMARSRAVSAEARSKLDKGNTSEALQTAREALKVHEQNVDAMLVIAEAYYKQGKFELVAVVTSSALTVDAKIRSPEESSRAYNLQGFALLGLGEEIQATQAFKKAAEVDENNAAAWNNMGTRYLDAGDVATATSCFKYALELDPRFHKAQLNYGAALRAEGKLEEAEAAMRKALELRPNYPEAYFNLGVLYLDADPFPGLDTTQRLNKAIQNLGKYRELAIADRGARPTKGPGMGGDGKSAPPRVSKDRADDFIRVAKKGLEREERRLEREKGKPADAGGAGGGEPAAGDPTEPGDAGAAAVGDDTTPASPDDGAPEQPTPKGPDAEPSKPTPQGPGTEPAKPTPQGPGTATPSKPAPQGPGTEPAKPAPQGPSTEPAKPAPQGPSTEPAKPAPQGPSTEPAKPAPQGPTTPTPSKPAPTPVKPAPQGPSTPTPTPVKPAPQGPTTPPAAPSPQKPTVQAPKTAAWQRLPPREPFEIILSNPASRGTRSTPSTLNPMAGHAHVPSRVDLASVLPAAAPRGIPRGIGNAQGHRSGSLLNLDLGSPPHETA